MFKSISVAVGALVLAVGVAPAAFAAGLDPVVEAESAVVADPVVEGVESEVASEPVDTIEPAIQVDPVVETTEPADPDPVPGTAPEAAAAEVVQTPDTEPATAAVPVVVEVTEDSASSAAVAEAAPAEAESAAEPAIQAEPATIESEPESQPVEAPAPAEAEVGYETCDSSNPQYREVPWEYERVGNDQFRIPQVTDWIVYYTVDNPGHEPAFEDAIWDTSPRPIPSAGVAITTRHVQSEGGIWSCGQNPVWVLFPITPSDQDGDGVPDDPPTEVIILDYTELDFEEGILLDPDNLVAPTPLPKPGITVVQAVRVLTGEGIVGFDYETVVVSEEYRFDDESTERTFFQTFPVASVQPEPITPEPPAFDVDLTSLVTTDPQDLSVIPTPVERDGYGYTGPVLVTSSDIDEVAVYQFTATPDADQTFVEGATTEFNIEIKYQPVVEDPDGGHGGGGDDDQGEDNDSQGGDGTTNPPSQGEEDGDDDDQGEDGDDQGDSNGRDDRGRGQNGKNNGNGGNTAGPKFEPRSTGYVPPTVQPWTPTVEVQTPDPLRNLTGDPVSIGGLDEATDDLAAASGENLAPGGFEAIVVSVVIGALLLFAIVLFFVALLGRREKGKPAGGVDDIPLQ